MGNSTLPTYAKVTDVADSLGCSRAMVYKLIDSGELPSVRIGGMVRIPVDALGAYLASKTRT